MANTFSLTSCSLSCFKSLSNDGIEWYSLFRVTLDDFSKLVHTASITPKAFDARWTLSGVMFHM